MTLQRYVAAYRELSQAEPTIMKLVLLALPIIMFAFITTVMYTQRIAETPINQLRDLAKGNMQAAYLLTSKSYQQKNTLAGFIAFITQHPALKNNEGIIFKDKQQNHHHGYVKGIVQTRDGSKATVEYQLIKEHAAWRITNIHVL